MTEMTEISSCRLKRLEMELHKATASGVCRWQMLTPDCVSASVGEYGIFLTKRGNFAWANIYHRNREVSNMKGHNFNILFDKSLKQATADLNMRGKDLIEMNSNALEISAQKDILRKKICKILHQP